MAETALVLVAHSAQLARACAEVAAQMAPDVVIVPVGGTAEAGIGTDYEAVERSITGALADGASHVVVCTDLGSATMTAETVQEMLADERVLVADAPFVEGAVAAAVAAQAGSGGQEARTAAEQAARTFGPVHAARGVETDGAGSGPAVRRTLRIHNRLGLHARPAAMLARKAAEFDARVKVNGVDATSVLALMGLGLTGGAELELIASGPQAAEAVETITADVEAAFGEE